MMAITNRLPDEILDEMLEAIWQASREGGRTEAIDAWIREVLR